MEIKYDLTNNSYNYFNESLGAYINQKKLINKKGNIYTLCGMGLLYLIFIIAFNIGCCVLLKLNIDDIFITFFFWFINFCNIVIFVYFAILVLSYMYYKNNDCKKGSLIFDEKGITDITDDGVKVGFSWDSLKYIIMKDHTITFIPKNKQMIICLDINSKEQVKKALKK